MKNISYQLYSSRNFPPVENTLTMLGRIGYTGVEGYADLLTTDAAVDSLKRGLDTSGLAIPTCHFGFELVRDAPNRVIELARQMGVDTVLVPAIADRVRDARGWADFGRELAEAAKPIEDAGLSFGWHNHDFEFADLGGVERPLDLILAGSENLALEIDVAWVVRAGHDPVEWIQRYAGRVTAVHLKDIAPAGQNAKEDGWADVGHGTLDWPAILAALESAPVRHFIVEHDNPSDDRRFAERSFAAARGF